MFYDILLRKKLFEINNFASLQHNFYVIVDDIVLKYQKYQKLNNKGILCWLGKVCLGMTCLS